MKCTAVIVSGVVCAGAWLSTDAATTTVYPTKTVRMVVNAAPGGANDVLGRMVAKIMTDSLRQNVVVDNRAGAGGNVGAEIVAHASPDGYTILYCTSSVVVSPSLYPRLNYKLSELAPLTQAASFPPGHRRASVAPSDEREGDARVFEKERRDQLRLDGHGVDESPDGRASR